MSDFDQDKVEQIQNTAALLQAQNQEEHALLHQLLGQVQMADAFQKFSVTVTTLKLRFVKEKQLYKSLKGQKNPDGYQFQGTWEEFCGLLGISREKADLDISNLNAFGEEAMEAMNRMGIGYREMRQYRKLPEDQKTALIEMAKTGDKESLLEFANEIISRQAKEKEALEKQLQEAKADYEAQGNFLKDTSEDLTQARIDLVKTRQRILKEAPDEARNNLQKEANTCLVAVISAITTKLTPALQALQDYVGEKGVPMLPFMSGLVNQVDEYLRALRDQFCLDPPKVPFGLMDDESIDKTLEQAREEVERIKKDKPWI